MKNWVSLGVGFTDLDKQGMLIEGFQELGTAATIYNYPYYQKHIEAHGYQKSIDWIEYELTVPEKIPDEIEKLAERVRDKYGLRNLEVSSTKESKKYSQAVFGLLNDTYSELYGVIKLTDEQIKFYTEQYFGYINPDFCSLILNKEDEVVAFGITMASLSKALKKSKGKLFPFGFIHILRAMKKNDRADFYLVGVQDKYRRLGAPILMAHKFHQSAKKIWYQNNRDQPCYGVK